MVAGMTAYFAGTAWIQNYLRSDAMRRLLEGRIGEAAGARCELEPVSWSGWNAYSAKLSLRPRGASSWQGIEAEGLQASLDWSAVRRGLWRVPEINLESLRVSLGGAAQSQDRLKPESDLPAGEAVISDPKASSWFSRWLPTRTEVGEIGVHRFDLKPMTEAAGPAIDAMHVKARPAADEGAWKIRGEDGRVRIPGIAEAFRLGSAAIRLDEKSLVLEDAAALWRGESEVTARGRVSFAGDQAWNFAGRVMALELRHLVSDAWRPKLGGVLEGDYEVAGRPGRAAGIKGKIRLKSGVVQSLPLLDRVAEYTHTERFRRVVLDLAAGELAIEGPRTRVTNIVLQSNGLIRVEGDLSIEGGVLAGDLRVGVSPETLRWLPGAQNHVFTEDNAGKVPGFVWTRVRVSGAVDSPKEDLSNRLLSAMGRAVLIDAPMELLDSGINGIGKAGVVLPGGDAVLEGGREVIKGASDAAGRGIDLLKDLIPLPPK